MTDIEITSDEMDQMINETSKSKRIAKSTGKPDKRTITSKINARKAGQVKLAKLKELPLQIIEDEMSDDSSSDDDNVLILKQKSNKNKKVATKRAAMPAQPDNFELFTLKHDIEQMKQLMHGLAKKKQKTKVIKVAAPPPPIQAPLPVAVVPIVSHTDIIADHMKKKLLNF
jgi:hypothetical protein